MNKGNSNVKQSFDHIVTLRKSVPGVKLGVMNCQSIILIINNGTMEEACLSRSCYDN